jgi:hypothetical protein
MRFNEPGLHGALFTSGFYYREEAYRFRATEPIMAIIYGHRCDLRLFRETYVEISKELTSTRGLKSRKGSVKPPLAPEPFRSCLAAEFHRQFWKPAEPRMVLLAESHVYTDEIDLACKMKTGMLPPDIQQSSPQFVRLIYCLGYGENALVRGTFMQPMRVRLNIGRSSANVLERPQLLTGASVGTS